MDQFTSPMIGEKAPHFQADTTFGAVSFPEDYKGKWVIFFSHPGDFTPVCTTELMTFANLSGEFTRRGCSLLGLSIDSNPSHIAWSLAMAGYQWGEIRNPQIDFPIVADDMGRVARLYGMLMPTASQTRTVRSVFYIDPEGTIRAILTYPLTTGRNTDELLRLLDALQTTDTTGHATPCNWRPGEPTVLPAPKTLQAANQRAEGAGRDGASCLSWYLCFAPAGSSRQPAARTGVSQPAAALEPPPAAVQPVEGRAADSAPRTAPQAAFRTVQAQPERPAEPARAKVEPAVRPDAQTGTAAPARRQFTLRELAENDGRNGRPALAAVGGTVYDISPLLASSPQMGLRPGRDLSGEFLGLSYLLTGLPVMGTLSGTASPGASASAVRPVAKAVEHDYQILRDFPMFRG